LKQRQLKVQADDRYWQTKREKLRDTEAHVRTESDRCQAQIDALVREIEQASERQAEVSRRQADARAKIEGYKRKDRGIKEAQLRITHERHNYEGDQVRQDEEVREKHNRVEQIKAKIDREQTRQQSIA
jgi:hypothetical protein